MCVQPQTISTILGFKNTLGSTYNVYENTKLQQNSIPTDNKIIYHLQNLHKQVNIYSLPGLLNTLADTQNISGSKLIKIGTGQCNSARCVHRPVVPGPSASVVKIVQLYSGENTNNSSRSSDVAPHGMRHDVGRQQAISTPLGAKA